jgi:hypothetical protein
MGSPIDLQQRSINPADLIHHAHVDVVRMQVIGTIVVAKPLIDVLLICHLHAGLKAPRRTKEFRVQVQDT